MRRAEARRSASVMISNSIKWSLAGYDVDWTMNTSDPRTFSWISTKISMSAKRRTYRFGQRRAEACGDGVGQSGVQFPAMSLIDPFFADIDASPRVIVATVFNITKAR